MMFVSSLVFLILVISGHYFAWRLCLEACPRLRPGRWYLLGFFILFSVSFLVSFILLHRSESAALASLYLVSAVLFGLLSQLMIAGTIYWLLMQLARLCAGACSAFLIKKRRLLARILVGLALSLFLLGTYNAFFPQVKTIFLSGWPAEYQGKSFIQLSDLHLGAIYRPAWLAMIVKKTNALQGDFIIISGDLFDGSDGQLAEFIPGLRSFAAPIVFVPGNHDYYFSAQEREMILSKSDLITLSDRAAILSGIEVIGFNYLNRYDSAIRREIKDLSGQGEVARIVVNHVPVDREEALSLKAKLMLSGHTHRGQLFPFSLFLNFLYGRFSYGLENYQGLTTYTSAGTGAWGPPLRTLFPGEIIKFVIK